MVASLAVSETRPSCIVNRTSARAAGTHVRQAAMVAAAMNFMVVLLAAFVLRPLRRAQERSVGPALARAS